MAGSFNFNQIKPLNPLLALFPTGMYGINHAYRVFKLVDRIGEFEGIQKETRQTLKFCALFSEIGRDEKTVDQNYGLKSFKKIEKKYFFEKGSFKNDLTRFLIECHHREAKHVQEKLEYYKLKNRNEAIFLLKVLKDAMCLDSFRFGNFCAVDLEFSNSKKLILFASQFCRKELKQDLILEEIENWLSEIQ